MGGYWIREHEFLTFSAEFVFPLPARSAVEADHVEIRLKLEIEAFDDLMIEHKPESGPAVFVESEYDDEVRALAHNVQELVW